MDAGSSKRRGGSIAAGPRCRPAVAVVAFACATALLLSGVTTASAAGTRGAPAAKNSGPRRGGSVTWGLEAETTGGYCMPSAQLAISGIMVTNAIYDTLTTLDAKGKYVP
jgi:peptide/nickel transport system substrate-binding protein